MTQATSDAALVAETNLKTAMVIQRLEGGNEINMVRRLLMSRVFYDLTTSNYIALSLGSKITFNKLVHTLQAAIPG